MRSLSSRLVLIVVLVSAYGGAFLYFPTKVTQSQAKDICRKYGMTLLELRSKGQMDWWNSVKTILFSMVPSPEEPWLGLQHDGRSPDGNVSSFSWLTGSTVTFLTWPKDTGEPDHLPNEACVRVREANFGTKSCSALFSTVCQATEGSGAVKKVIKAFTRTYYKKTNDQEVTRYSLKQVLGPQLWLVADSSYPATDPESSVVHCQDSKHSCLGLCDPVHGCHTMNMVNLTAVPDPNLTPNSNL